MSYWNCDLKELVKNGRGGVVVSGEFFRHRQWTVQLSFVLGHQYSP